MYMPANPRFRRGLPGGCDSRGRGSPPFGGKTYVSIPVAQQQECEHACSVLITLYMT